MKYGANNKPNIVNFIIVLNLLSYPHKKISHSTHSLVLQI